MKSRLVVAALLPRDVVARARDAFDVLVVEGSDDMTAPETVDAAIRHRADAILFTNTLPLSAEAIVALPPSVRVGATSSVGYDHIDVAAAKDRIGAPARASPARQRDRFALRQATKPRAARSRARRRKEGPERCGP